MRVAPFGSVRHSRWVPDAPGRSAVELGWRWDRTLYAGSAAHYAAGRVPYPTALATALVTALGLNRSQRLLDVGCGPGSLTLLLAPYVAEAVGVDADEDMLGVAAQLAGRQHSTNVSWRHLRAEDLPADLARMDVVLFAQSFHWMDRARVAAAARALLAPGGAVVHVHATTHRGAGDDIDDPELAYPRPPWDAIIGLVRTYLGPQPRAGQSVLPEGGGGGEAPTYRAAGFTEVERLTVPGWIVERSAEQILAAVHSLSWATPHLFGGYLAGFDAELRQLLADASSNGRFSERMGNIDVDIWS